MTITVDWQTATDVTAQAMRYGLGAAMLKSSAATPRAGVLRTDALKASAAGGSMDVSVSAGQAMIAGYAFTSDDTTTVTLDVGGASARTDLIVARVYDEEAGDASTEGAIEVVKGTSSSVPDTPDRAIVLASVAVAASASTISGANLTDKRQMTTGQGGLLWLPGGLAAAVPSWLDDGAAIWDSSADQIGVNDGGTWKKFADVGSLIGPDRAVDLGASTDLDTLRTPGWWYQDSNDDATPVLHYPVLSAGALEVLRWNPSSDRVIQRYSTYNNGGVYVRTYFGTSWTSWKSFNLT